MIYQFRTFSRIVSQRILDIDFRQRIIALYKEYPGISIEISRVVRFQFHRQRTHPFRLFQVFLFQREEIGVVVEDDYILIIVFQSVIIGFISFRHILNLIVDIADLPVEIRLQAHVCFRDNIQSCPVSVERILVFLLLEISDSEVEIIFRSIREEFLAAGADTDHFRNILRFQRQIQELLPSCGIRRLHLGNQLELETGFVVLPLCDKQAAVHLFQVNIFGMLF